MNRRPTAAAAVMTTVRAYGVDTVFGVPGTHNLELYRPLPALGIRAVTTRHEQGAGFAADGWAQRSGLPGVVLATSGPGLLNVLSAAASAQCESRPLLVLAPGPPTRTRGRDMGMLHQSGDIAAAAAHLLGRSVRTESAEQAVEEVHRAFAMCATGRPHATLVEIPLDILETPVDLAPDLLTARTPGAAPAAQPSEVARADDLLSAAERPVILAGGGARAAGSQVLTLAELLGAPVVTTVNGKGVIDERHPLALGCEIRLAELVDRCNAADPLIVVGSRLGAAEFWDRTVCPPSMVRIDIDPAQVRVNAAPTVALVGDAAVVLEQILAGLPGPARRPPTGLEAVRQAVRSRAEQMAPDLVEVNRAVTAALPGNTIVAGDSSQVTYLGTCGTFTAREPAQLLYMPTYATLGYGVPAALGAALAEPTRPVVAVVGDGALAFSLQELLTVVQERVRLVIVCVDNGGYGEIRANMTARAIGPFAVDLVQPDWVALATAIGMVGARATTASRLTEAVGVGLAREGATLIHVPLPLRG